MAKLSMVVRFIMTILLSAPSIVVGLFVQRGHGRPMGHFSDMRAAVALALLAFRSWSAPPKTCGFWCRGAAKAASALGIRGRKSFRKCPIARPAPA